MKIKVLAWSGIVEWDEDTSVAHVFTVESEDKTRDEVLHHARLIAQLFLHTPKGRGFLNSTGGMFTWTDFAERAMPATEGIAEDEALHEAFVKVCKAENMKVEHLAYVDGRWAINAYMGTDNDFELNADEDLTEFSEVKARIREREMTL